MDSPQALSEFCARIAQDQYRPNQAWIADMLLGMFASGSTMLSEIGRGLDETNRDGLPSRLIHTEKRLSRGLCSDRLDDEALARRHREIVAEWTLKDDGRGVVCAVDYTDISKPRAHLGETGMEGVCKCYDGSKGRPGTGYPVVQVEADIGHLSVPLVLYPFSYDEITKSSQINVFLAQIEEVAPYVGSQAWWTSDRGFDNPRYFAGMDALNLRWICRLQYGIQSQRSLFMADGSYLTVKEAALETIPRYTVDGPPTNAKRKKETGRDRLRLEIGARKVYLSDQKNPAHPTGPARTLIVVWGFGQDPIVTLASEHLEGREAICEAALAYGRRWKCEEATRAAKDHRGWGVALEDVRALTLRGIRRMALLTSLLYTFMASLREHEPELVEAVIKMVAAFGKVPPDPRYRLFRGLSRLFERGMQRARALVRALLRRIRGEEGSVPKPDVSRRS